MYGLFKDAFQNQRRSDHSLCVHNGHGLFYHSIFGKCLVSLKIGNFSLKDKRLIGKFKERFA